jgi:gas vesicle protein
MRAELGFLAGLGAGVTVGLLFAPKSGKQTKHFIAQKARRSLSGRSLVAETPTHRCQKG